ncbi:MAG: hypothetical protein AAGI11_09285 [Pseudomonadota bacterium]
MSLLRTDPARLRLIPAVAMTLTGAALLSALWFRDLNETAVLDALAGAIYLFVAIGLFGSSRFSLFVAMGVAGASALYAAAYLSPGPWLTARLIADGLIVASAGATLITDTSRP